MKKPLKKLDIVMKLIMIIIILLIMKQKYQEIIIGKRILIMKKLIA